MRRLGFPVMGLVADAALYLQAEAPPACDSAIAETQVTGILRDRFHLDGLFVNNVHTVAGGPFSRRRDCAAEVASIRGNVNASDMTWREVRYRIEPGGDLSLTLGGSVPLAGPPPSWWERLAAWL